MPHRGDYCLSLHKSSGPPFMLLLLLAPHKTEEQFLPKHPSRDDGWKCGGHADRGGIPQKDPSCHLCPHPFFSLVRAVRRKLNLIPASRPRSSRRKAQTISSQLSPRHFSPNNTTSLFLTLHAHGILPNSMSRLYEKKNLIQKVKVYKSVSRACTIGVGRDIIPVNENCTAYGELKRIRSTSCGRCGGICAEDSRLAACLGQSQRHAKTWCV